MATKKLTDLLEERRNSVRGEVDVVKGRLGRKGKVVVMVGGVFQRISRQVGGRLVLYDVDIAHLNLHGLNK
jgi:hypothetical protein